MVDQLESLIYLFILGMVVKDTVVIWGGHATISSWPTDQSNLLAVMCTCKNIIKVQRATIYHLLCICKKYTLKIELINTGGQAVF